MNLAHMSWANGIHGGNQGGETCQLFLVKVTIEKIIYDIKLINNPAIGPMDKKVQIVVGLATSPPQF